MATKNFNISITTLDGEVIKDGTESTANDLTVKKAVVAALQAQMKDDDKLTAAQLYKNMSVADRINSAEGDVQVESEDIVNIKERVAKGWPPIVLYRVVQLLEG